LMPSSSWAAVGLLSTCCTTIHRALQRITCQKPSHSVHLEVGVSDKYKYRNNASTCVTVLRVPIVGVWVCISIVVWVQRCATFVQLFVGDGHRDGVAQAGK
jgi:hypothetical protein